LVEEESGESGSSGSSSSSSGSGSSDSGDEVTADDIALDMSAYGTNADNYSTGDKLTSVSKAGYLKVPDNNDTGKMINLMFKMYKAKSKQRPKVRGNSIVLMYNEAYSDSEPSLTLGPEWKFSLSMFVLINFC
jgi:hypothetical protein